MDGGSLYRLVDSLQAHERTLSYKQKVSILGDIICALNYLHELHIVHRDISSPNILLTSGLVAKLSDFGMSRFFNSTRLRPGTLAPGCPLYMPPEALVSGEFTEKGDIFSYAIIAIELIIEKHPHPNEKEDDRKNFCSKANEIPGLMPLEGLVEDCLDCEPQNRPSANDIVLKLKNILDSLPEDQGKPTPWQQKPKPVQVSEMHQITSPRIILSTNGKYGSVLCPDQSSLGSVHGDSELGEENVDEENCETQKYFHEVWEDKVDEDGKIEKQNIEMEHESKPRECVSSVGPAKECTDASNQESGVDGSTLVCLKPASMEDCVNESVKSQLVVGFNSQKGLQTQFCLDLNSTLESQLSPLGCLTRAEVASESGPNEVFESEVGHTSPRDRENNCSDSKSLKGSDSPKQSRDNKVEDGKKGTEKDGKDEEATQKAKTPMKPGFRDTDMSDHIPVSLKQQQFSDIPTLIATDSQLASLLCLTLVLSLPTLLKARAVSSIQSTEERSTTTTQKTGGGKDTSEDGLNESKRDGAGHSSHVRDGENDNNSCIKGGSPKHRQNSHRKNIRDNYPRSEKRTKAKMPTMECLVFNHHWDPMATTYCFSVEDQFRLPNIFCLTLALSLPTLLKIKPTFPPFELCTPLQMISLPPSKESTTTTSHASDSSSSEDGGKDRSGPNEMFKGEIGHTLSRGRDKNSDSKNLKGSDSRKQCRDEVEDGKKGSENDGEDEVATQKAKTPMKPAFKETDKSDHIPINLKPQQFSNIPATDSQLASLLCLTLALSLPTLLKARPVCLPLDLCKPFGMPTSIQSREEKSTTTTQKTGGTCNNGGGKDTSEKGLNESKRDGAGHSSHARDGENDNNSCTKEGSQKHGKNCHRKNIRHNNSRSEVTMEAKMSPNFVRLTVALSLLTILKIQPTFPPLEVCTPVQMISLPPSTESTSNSHGSHGSSSEDGDKDTSENRLNKGFEGGVWHSLPGGREENSGNKDLKRSGADDGKKGSEENGEDEEATQKAKTPMKPAFKEQTSLITSQ